MNDNLFSLILLVDDEDTTTVFTGYAVGLYGHRDQAASFHKLAIRMEGTPVLVKFSSET